MNKMTPLLFLFFTCFVSVANADEDVKQEIIDRCRASMGEYGSSLVKACVDRDIEALQQLNQLVEAQGAIVGGCMNRMREYGFAMVLACAERDIQAEEELSKY